MNYHITLKQKTKQETVVENALLFLAEHFYKTLIAVYSVASFWQCDIFMNLESLTPEPPSLSPPSKP